VMDYRQIQSIFDGRTHIRGTWNQKESFLGIFGFHKDNFSKLSFLRLKNISPHKNCKNCTRYNFLGVSEGDM
jgi:hypothetical protein